MSVNKKGSVAIETAISFTIVILLIVAIVSSVCVKRTDIIMQAAVEASCEKIALYTPLSVPVADVAFTAINALPNSEEYEGTAANIVSGATSLVTGIDDVTSHYLLELILNGTLGNLMRDDIATEFYKRNGNSEFYAPSDINVTYNINDIHSVIDVFVEYQTDSILGSRTRNIYAVIPVYGDFELILNGIEDEENSVNDIWAENNFTRGDYFREAYGANLPKTFPVIDSFASGHAESIMSIDLTAPTYNANNDAAYLKIIEEVDQIEAFNGADVMINGNRYSVSAVSSRTIHLIIPSNSSDTCLTEVYSAVNYGQNHGVEVVVHRDGESTRYCNN